jgi:hypothetical protein
MLDLLDETQVGKDQIGADQPSSADFHTLRDCQFRQALVQSPLRLGQDVLVGVSEINRKLRAP